MARVISVCDREADVYEYLSDKCAHNERFIVRACWNRRVQIQEPEGANAAHLYAALSQARQVAGRFIIPAESVPGPFSALLRGKTRAPGLEDAALRESGRVRPDGLQVPGDKPCRLQRCEKHHVHEPENLPPGGMKKLRRCQEFGTVLVPGHPTFAQCPGNHAAHRTHAKWTPTN